MLRKLPAMGPLALDARSCPIGAASYRHSRYIAQHTPVRHSWPCPSRFSLRCRSFQQNSDREAPSSANLTPLPVESLQSLGGDSGHQNSVPDASGSSDGSTYGARTWSASPSSQSDSSSQSSSSSSSSSTSQQASESGSPFAASLAVAAAVAAAASKAPAAAQGTQPALPGAWSWLPRLLLPPILRPRSAVRVLVRATQLLRTHLWPILAVYALKDLLSFLLHRISQRLTNLTSDVLLGTTVSQTANPWWLYLDSHFLEGHLGYQACIVLFFLASLPLNILLSSAAATLAALVCTKVPALPTKAPGQPDLIALAQHAQAVQAVQGTAEEAGSGGVGAQAAATPCSTQSPQSHTQPALWVPLSGLLARFRPPGAGSAKGSAAPPAAPSTSGTPAAAPGAPVAAAAGAAAEKAAAVQAAPQLGLIGAIKDGVTTARLNWPEAAGMLRRVWWVDMLFNMRALPLQALSLLVIPVVWTVPRLLAIQLALPVAVLEGKTGKEALARSSELMAGLRAAYGWPFITLICAIRVLDVVRNALLAAMPGRWWQEVIEVPLAATAAFSAAKLLVIRLQDLLPLAAYLIATSGPKDVEGEEDGMLPAAPTQVPTI